MLQMKMMS